MKNILAKIGVGMAAFGAFLTVGLNNAKAAANEAMANVLGTTSPAYLEDNQGIILTWFGVVFGFTVIITIVLAALSRAKRQIGGTVGGGRRRR